MKACILGGGVGIGGTRVELEAQSGRLAILSEPFSATGVRIEGAEGLEDGRPVVLGPFTVTPFVGHHLDLDACAVLVEADGASLFYVGELRAGAVHKLLAAPPRRVDVMLIEAATIGKATSPDGFQAEAAFEEKFVALFQQTRGMPLVWCSPNNPDRLATIYRACLRSKRLFIVDARSAAAVVPAGVSPEAARDCGITVHRLGGRRKPAATAVVAALPEIANDELAAAAPTSVVVFRPELMPELERARCLAGARLVFSMWSGYLEYENANPVLEWLERNGISLEQCHTSGHAGTVELIRLRDAFPTAAVVPIRATRLERFEELFGRVERRVDGEWWSVAGARGSGLGAGG